MARRSTAPETAEGASAFLYRGLREKLESTQKSVAFHDVPTTDNELHEWVHRYLGVWIPRDRCCPEHVAPFEAFADAYFARSSMAIWHASRGFGGKTFTLSTLALTEAITLGCSTTILGGSMEQSQRVQAYLTNEDENARGIMWEWPRAPRSMIREQTKTKLRLTNGAQVKALAASGRSVRGAHPQRLRMDECDEMDLDVFDSAMGQTMKGRSSVLPQTVAASTHHIPDGTMTELLRRAKEFGWPVYEWCYRENLTTSGRYGWLEPSEIERKKLEVSHAMWEIEYELQEPAPGRRAILPEAVKLLFNKELGFYRGDPHKPIEIYKPHHLRRFYHGADFAKSEDWFIHHVMEERGDGPDRLAYWHRTGRLPYSVMVGNYDRDVGRYGGRSYHDATGIGEVIEDYLVEASHSIGFDFRHTKLRAEMLSNYIAAIEHGVEQEPKMVFPMIEYAYGEYLYATMEDVYGGSPKAHLPDSLAAGALAWHAKEFGIDDSVTGYGAPVKK